MGYIRRTIEATVEKAATMFPVVLITGARQVGKTTLLKHLKGELSYLTLDDPILLQSATEEPGRFFKMSSLPIIVDEIQHEPNLFRHIKMIADQSQEKGQFYLTGSQQFHLMKEVGESLAGRVGIINLMGLSLREITGDSFDEAFLPTEEYFNHRKGSGRQIGYKDIWQIIHQGSMPAMYADELDWQMYYASYTRTYIERDVRALTQVGDEVKFTKFMTAMAARTGQMLNMTAVANEVGISVPTADRWLSILVSSNLVHLLQPYSKNLIKRIVKTPKLYFLDTGLAAYLTRWTTHQVLEAGAMAGAFFETYVVAEILKSYYNVGIIDPPLYYYRDKDAKEIDLVIEQNGTLYPLEIKKTVNPDRHNLENFSVLDKINGIASGSGGVVCLYDKLVPIKGDKLAIPVSWL